MSVEANLPEGWTEGTLARLLSGGVFTDGDWVESKDQDPAGDVRLVQLADVGDGVYRDRSARFLTSAKARELNCTFLERGDVLIARMPDPLGRACIFPGDSKRSVTVVDVCIARPPPGGANARWLMHTVNSAQVRRAMDEHERGTTRKRISRTNLGTVVVPVPPLPEQHRIVTQVEALLEQVSRAKGRLDRVPLILKRFRQSVLAAACSGELTKEWREGRAVDRSVRSVVRDAAKFVEGQEYVRRRSNNSHDNETAYEADGLPEEWTAVPLSAVAVILSGQTAKNMDARVAAAGRFPWFKVGDMNTPGNERWMNAADEWLTDAAVELLGLRPLPAGAVIFPKRGGAIATNKKRVLARPSCVDLNTMAFIAFEPLAPYLWWWFASVDLASLSDGSNVPQLNHPDIEPLIVPLPPLVEQAEIVRQVEKLFALADRIEGRVKAATLRADRVPRAILSKAFAGELVPTEAELARAEGRAYETAEELLSRLSGGAASRSMASRKTRRAKQ